MSARTIVTNRTITSSRDGAFLRFNGITGNIASSPFSAPTTTTSVTMAAWVRLRDDGVNSAASQPVITYAFWRMHFRSVTNNLNFRFDEVAAHTASDNGSNLQSDRSWHHFVGVYNFTGGSNNTQILYRDNVSKATTNNTVLPTSNYGSANLIGGANANFGTANMDMYDIRIYNGYAFSATDVSNLYNFGSNPVTPQIWYQFNTDIGTQAIDISGNNITGTITGNTTWLPQARASAVRGLV